MKTIKSTVLFYLLIMNSFIVSAQKWYSAEIDKKVEKLLKQMTIEEKLSYIGGVDWMYTHNIDRLGIHRMKMSDGPQGLGTHGQSTAYPSTVMLAATWNEDLAYQYGKALGLDCRARGVNILLGPAVNIYRAPMCGRNFEYMGEDPYLVSRIAVGYIKGIQDQGVMATIKHFIANNSDYDRDNISNDMDERTMHEIYLPAFKAAVQEAEVGAVMTSYNLMNGIYTTENPYLLKEVLRKQWGFNGLIMSDWGSTHHTIPAVKNGLDLEMPGGTQMNPKEMAYYLRTGDITMDMIDEKVRHILRVLIAFGFQNGTNEDKSIPLDNPASATTALKVAREGVVLLKNEKNLLPLNSQKIRHIIVTGKNTHGYIYGGGSGKVTPFHYVDMFEGIKKEAASHNIRVEYVDELDFLPQIIFTGDENSEPGFTAEYFTNMELKGTPIHKATEKKISYSWSNGTGIQGMQKENYSVRWSGVIRVPETADYDFALGGDDAYRLFINDEPIINEWSVGAYRNSGTTYKLQSGKNYRIRVEYYQKGGGAGINFTWKKPDDTRSRFAEYLDKADLIIACFGHNSDSEGEGSDRTFSLPDVDTQLLSSVAKCRKPVIGIVNGAGQEAGTAIAELLFGKVNPSGKLPMTFEKKWEDNPAYNSYYDTNGDKHVQYSEGIFVGYRGYDKQKKEVQYPFGYGLSYTTFKLTDLKVSEQQPDGSVNLSCRLANTGKTPGSQVVQTYVGRKGGTIERPEKELKKFKKIFLNVGESTTINLTLPKSSFTYYDTNQKDFVIDAGDYTISLGFSSRDIKIQKSIQIK